VPTEATASHHAPATRGLTCPRGAGRRAPPAPLCRPVPRQR